MFLFVLAISACHADKLPVDQRTTAEANKQSATAENKVAQAKNYSLPNSYVHELVSEVNGRHYDVWVNLPASYTENPDKKYPVVFVADAAFGFPVMYSLRNFVGKKGQNIEDFILVGLTYETGLDGAASRNRDYTPTMPAKLTNDYQAKEYGQADQYLDVIQQQIFPLIGNTYRADMQRKMVAGHSYGALLGSYALLTRPDMFSMYLLSSPSLQFDNGKMFAYEEDYAKNNQDLNAKVRMYVGGYEAIGSDPLYNKTIDMEANMKKFEARLKSRHYPHLDIASKTNPEFGHRSSAAVNYTRGLLALLPGEGPFEDE